MEQNSQWWEGRRSCCEAISQESKSSLMLVLIHDHVALDYYCVLNFPRQKLAIAVCFSFSLLVLHSSPKCFFKNSFKANVFHSAKTIVRRTYLYSSSLQIRWGIAVPAPIQIDSISFQSCLKMPLTSNAWRHSYMISRSLKYIPCNFFFASLYF